MKYAPLPEFVPANTTRAELLRILEPCMSRELFRLIEGAIGYNNKVVANLDYYQGLHGMGGDSEMRATEACFLPTYFASNTSHEERLAAIRDQLPEAMIGWIEDMLRDIEDDGRQDAINEAYKTLEGGIGKALTRLRERFGEGTGDLLDPAGITLAELPGMVEAINDEIDRIEDARRATALALGEYAE